MISKNAFSLDGKTALVTGGRRGIGKEIALMFARNGADVIVCDFVVEDGALENVARKIRNLGRRSISIRCDISNKGSVADMRHTMVESMGTVDVLFNNAFVTNNNC